MPAQWSEVERVPLVCIAPKFFSPASVSEGHAQPAVNLFDRKVVRLFTSIFYMARNLPFTAKMASRQNSRLTVAKTATTFFSLQPHISK